MRTCNLAEQYTHFYLRYNSISIAYIYKSWHSSFAKRIVEQINSNISVAFNMLTRNDVQGCIENVTQGKEEELKNEIFCDELK